MLAIAWSHNERNKSYCGKYPSTHYCRYSAEFGRPTGLDTKARGAQVDPSEKESREYQAFQAQIDAAEWAFWASIAAFATVLITGAGIYYVQQTLDANRRAVLETAKAAEAAVKQTDIMLSAERPWVFFANVKITGPLDNTKNRCKTMVSYEIKNSGRVPGLYINTQVQIFVHPPEGIYTTHRAAAAKVLEWYPNAIKHQFGFASPPGDNGITEENIQGDIPVEFRKPEQPLSEIYLVGWITYTNPTDSSAHQSGFSYRIYPHNTPGDGPKYGKVSAPDQLRLNRENGGFFAT